MTPTARRRGAWVPVVAAALVMTACSTPAAPPSPAAQPPYAAARSRRRTSRSRTRPGGGRRAPGSRRPNDLARWVEALVGGDLLNADLQEQRLDSVRPIVPDNPDGRGYGLALAKFGELYGHVGDIPGYNSFMGYDPERRITLVTWATPDPAVDSNAPADEMAAAVMAELYG